MGVEAAVMVQGDTLEDDGDEGDEDDDIVDIVGEEVLEVCGGDTGDVDDVTSDTGVDEGGMLRDEEVVLIFDGRELAESD